MNLENVLSIIDRFDHSESVTLELQMEDITLKLKKADGIAAKAVTSAPVYQAAAMPLAANQGTSEMQQMAAGQQMASTQQENTDSVHSSEKNAEYIKAPLVGVFYDSPSPEKSPFVSVGSRVEKGDTVCLIEAMKMMSEVTASKSGVIEEIMVENGSLVEYDMPLFRIQEK